MLTSFWLIFLTERPKIEIYKRIREIENQERLSRTFKDEIIDRFGEYPDQVAYLIEIGLVKAYLDAAFAELVERKNDIITVRFEKSSLKFLDSRLFRSHL